MNSLIPFNLRACLVWGCILICQSAISSVEIYGYPGERPGATTVKVSAAQDQAEAEPARADRSGVNHIHCWYEVIARVNELRAYGKVLMVTDIDDTLIRDMGQRAYRVVQPEMKEIMAWLRAAENVDLLGLTARAGGGSTEKQLADLDVPIFTEETPLLMTEQSSKEFHQGGYSPFFKNNIIYRSKYNKGKTLATFLKVVRQNYHGIIFIDDIEKNCEYVLKKLKGMTSEVAGFNYRPRHKGCQYPHVLPNIKRSSLMPISSCPDKDSGQHPTPSESVEPKALDSLLSETEF